MSVPSGHPSFLGQLVRVRRNRFVLALCALPLLYPLFMTSLMTGTGSAVMTGVALFQGVFVSFIAAMLVWQRNPWPRRDVVNVEADAVGIDVDGERTPREALEQGFVVPALDETKIVLARKGVAPPIELISQGVQEARHVLVALGFDASQTVARFRTLSRLFADLRAFFIPFAIAPFCGLFGFLFSRSHGAIGPAAAGAFLVPMLLLLVASVVPARLTVGADGIEIRWFGRRRFIRHTDVVNASQYISGVGNSRYTGVALTLESGEEVRIPVGQARFGNDRSRMVLERIQEAAAEGKRDHVELDPAILARAGRDVGDWMRALRSLGAGANATMRTAPIEAERLWRIVEDPAGQPLARAAAAVALTADHAADARRRLRAAAEATAAPRLRIAIDAAASHDEDALKEALAELESEESPLHKDA